MTLRVLIVEDEALIAMDLEEQVISLGHEVTGCAQDVASCKSDAQAVRPDVALMDLRLAGGTSGIDAAIWLYDTLGVRCIFISGNLDENTCMLLSERVAAIAFVGKPILRHKLLEALAKV